MFELINNTDKIRAFLDAVGSIQAILFAIYFFYKARENKTFYYFGIILLVYSSGLFVFLLEFFDFYNQYPKLRYLPVNFNYLFTPLLYLYVFKVSVFKKDKIIGYIFIPALIELLIGITLLVANHDSYIFGVINQIIHSSAYYFFVPYDILISVLIINLINKHSKIAKEQYSNMQIVSLEWCKTIAIIHILFLIVYTFYIFVPVFGKHTSLFDIVLTVFNVLYIYWMSIKGLEQKTIYSFIETSNSKISDVESIKEPISLTKGYIDTNFNIINETIIKNKLYANKNLTIIDIAKVVKIHQKKVSQIINSYTNQNFNAYINTFRITEAKRMLKDSQYNVLSIAGIGTEAGFNSKSAFYRAFKDNVGLTPKEYRNDIKKK